MNKYLAAFCLLLVLTLRASFADALIVADEIPAMELVARKLKAEEHIDSKVIRQTEMPESLKSFDAVVVYIHGKLSEKAEDAFIDYTKKGGKLVVIHHSISSGKAKNAHWFSFLGVSLTETNVDKGGYKWIEPAKWEIVNINPNHFITTNKLIWLEQIDYTTTNAPARKTFPGFTLEDDEVYLNHVLTEQRTKLEGFDYKYTALFEEEKPGAPRGYERRVQAVRVRGGYFFGHAKRRRR